MTNPGELRGEELAAAIKEAGGQRAAAKAWGIPRSTLQDRLKVEAPASDGRVEVAEAHGEMNGEANGTSNGVAVTEPASVVQVVDSSILDVDIETWKHKVSPFQVIEVVADKVTSRSMTLKKTATYQDVYVLVAALGIMADSAGFWYGDVIRQAEAKWGEKYTHMLEVSGKSKGTLQNYVYMAENVAPDVRRDDLSEAHHYAVASIKGSNPQERAEMQKAWLDRAANDQLTVTELREKMRTEEREEYASSARKNIPHSSDPEEVPEIKREVERHRCSTCSGTGWVEVVVEYN